MSEQKKRDEVAKVLSLIYYEWGKPITQELITYWVGNLRGVRKDFVWKVARELVRRKTYGEPKFQDFWNVALELSKRQRIGRPYNPWNSPDEGPPMYELTDIPGRMIEIGDKPETFELPQPREGRREITTEERKWIGYTGKKDMQ